MPTPSPSSLKILQLADDFLLAGQRLCQWCGHGPYLEEDLALSNMALDLLGAAQEIYHYLVEEKEKELESIAIDGGRKKSVQNLVYFRSERNFTNHILFELPKGHFGMTILKQYILALYSQEFLQNWDHPLAKKIQMQMNYHLEHCSYWIKILCLGDDEEIQSLKKMQEALTEITPYLPEFQGTFMTSLKNLFEECGLQFCPHPIVLPPFHTEHIGYLLAEMQQLPRSYPDALW